MALLTTIRDLHRRKARERRGLALAEGIRLVEEMVACGHPCKGAVVAPSLQGTPRGAALHRQLVAQQVPIEEVSDDILAGVAATEHPQGIIVVYVTRRWTFEELAPARRKPLVILDAVQDPGNVGTIARTALSFGGAGMIALPGTSDLTNPKTVRGAMGALFRLPHLHADHDATLDYLKRGGVALWAAAADGESIDTLTRPEHPVALALGNEGAGIGTGLLDRAERRISIPISAGTESLNVAVAAGILLYWATR